MDPGQERGGPTLLQRTRKGVVWVGFVSVGSKIMTVVTTLILTRVLSPADFGMVAIASIVMAALAIFTDLGLGAAIIHSRANRQRMASTAFFMMPAIGATLYVFAFMTAPLLATLLGNPGSTDIIRLATVNIVIASLTIVPSALLEKDMAYRRKVIPDLAPTAVYITVALVLATQFGLGGYSIVFGWVAQGFTSLVLNWTMVRWRPSPVFDLAIARELVGYGKNVLGGSVIGYLSTNLDNVLVSRAVGGAGLGYYTLAYSITNLPATHITDVLARVLFPSFVELRDDPARLRKAFVRALKVLIIVTLPLLVGLAVVAGPFVHVVMGDRWLPLVPVIQIVAVFAAVRAMLGPTGSMFLATGRTGLMFVNGLVNLALQAVTLWVALFVLDGGIVGAAAAVSTAAVLDAVFVAALARLMIPYRPVALVKPVARLAAPAVVMGLVVAGLVTVLPATLGALALEIVAGGVVYVATLLLLNSWSELTALVGPVRRSEAA